MENKVVDVGVENIELNGQSFELSFPDGADIRTHIRSIVTGREYSHLKLDYSPKCIIDIGANIGAAAFFFRRHYPNARICCFEPSPSTFDFLERNTAPLSNIELFPFGLFNCDKEVKLYRGKLHCLQNSIVLHQAMRSDYEMVQFKEARRAIAPLLQSPTILKLDIEGCELQVIENLYPLLAQIEIVYLEYHSECDRIAIDNLLSSTFKLWSAQANEVHRGQLAYLSNTLLARFPELEKSEIASHPPA